MIISAKRSTESDQKQTPTQKFHVQAELITD